MGYLPNIERIESGPAWMDATAYTEEHRLADAEYMAKQEAEALADLYAAPTLKAIRAIPSPKCTKEVIRQILVCVAAKVLTADWAETEAGQTAAGGIDDLASDLEVL